MTLYFNYPCICTFESLKSFTFSVHLGYQHIFFKRIFFKKKFFCSLKEFFDLQVSPDRSYNFTYVQSFVCQLVHLFVCPFICSQDRFYNFTYVQSFVCLLVHLFSCSFIRSPDRSYNWTPGCGRKGPMNQGLSARLSVFLSFCLSVLLSGSFLGIGSLLFFWDLAWCQRPMCCCV